MGRRWIAFTVVVLLAGGGCDKGTERRATVDGGATKEAGAAPGTPQRAYEDMVRAVARDDWDSAWAFISDRSRQHVLSGEPGRVLASVKDLPEAALSELGAEIGRTPAELRVMTPEQLMKALFIAETKKSRDELVQTQVVSVDTRGETAVLTVRHGDGATSRKALLRENGVWKLDGEETDRLNAGTPAPGEPPLVPDDGEQQPEHTP